MREPERLIARIRQIRRASATADDAAKRSELDRGQERLHALEARMSHLEALVEGLQDSVHRQFSRHAERVTELEARTQPGELGKALSDDARARGL